MCLAPSPPPVSTSQTNGGTWTVRPLRRFRDSRLRGRVRRAALSVAPSPGPCDSLRRRAPRPRRRPPRDVGAIGGAGAFLWHRLACASPFPVRAQFACYLFGQHLPYRADRARSARTWRRRRPCQRSPGKQDRDGPPVIGVRPSLARPRRRLPARPTSRFLFASPAERSPSHSPPRVRLVLTRLLRSRSIAHVRGEATSCPRRVVSQASTLAGLSRLRFVF